METVAVTLYRNSLLADMMVKSHAEVAFIPDDKERYLAELGTEKAQEAHQCITNAAAELSSALRDVLSGFSTGMEAADNYDSSSDIYFSFYVTERKAPGLADALAKNAHAYVVDSALAKFYGSVSRPELVKTHSDRMAAEMSAIIRLVHVKAKPMYQ